MLHHEKRHAVVRCSAVNKPRNIRMLQICQNLPFVEKTSANLGGIYSRTNYLYRDFLLKFAIRALAEKDRSHPAAAEFAYYPVTADRLADQSAGSFIDQALRI